MPLLTRNSHDLDMENKEKEGWHYESDSRYEDVDPHGYSIFALRSGPKKDDGEDVCSSNVPPSLPVRKYEDVDPHGDAILVLGSGLQRAAPKEPPPRHLAKIEMQDSRLSTENENDEEVRPPARNSRHLDMGAKEKEQVDGMDKESNRKYEDVDPHGHSVFALGPGPDRQYTEDVSGTDAPPPLPKRNSSHLDRGYKENEVDGMNEEANRKYEDVDLEPGAVNVILNSGLKRAVPDLLPPRKLDMGDHVVVYAEQKEDSCSDPYYKPEDRAGHKAGEPEENVDSKPPQALDMGDHVVVYPEQKEEPYSDPYYQPGKTDEDEKQEEKSFGLKVKGSPWST
ncbi:Hypp7274 [Branchiostoma lanceolatum]|uniref:Hypp7274 protein n=1 Tax=Branchiostoma lanceolatum TaxID=7740 RepID=A0A8J9YZB2_BRALA|nr:Hypp7274 [Branchiostoma lanceolatum]